MSKRTDREAARLERAAEQEWATGDANLAMVFDGWADDARSEGKKPGGNPPILNREIKKWFPRA